MLQLSGALINRPILSLQTGTPVGVTTAAIINPNNLKIEGFYCHDDYSKKELVLLYQDIRDVIPQGLIINDQEVLTEPDELVRLKNVMGLHFELLGKPVVTVSKNKIGKVSDFATDTTTMFIQKIYVSQSLLKSFSSGNLGIDRTQIVEITDRKVVVNDLEQKVPAHAAAAA